MRFLETVVADAEARNQGRKCSLIGQDSPHVINAGFLMFKKDGVGDRFAADWYAAMPPSTSSRLHDQFFMHVLLMKYGVFELGMTQSDYGRPDVLKAVDTNGDGTTSKDEFNSWLARLNTTGVWPNENTEKSYMQSCCTCLHFNSSSSSFSFSFFFSFLFTFLFFSFPNETSL